MLFLIVLVLATAGAAVADRHDRRAIARRGMAIAMAVAGAAHLVMPPPFEQHLPDWVPAATLVVWISGVVEIAIGIALLVAPGRPRSRARRVVGRLTAAYFVAVFPANVYVAAAGVDVDGQPGGVYPWLRLPFQALFVAWVLWSTADRRPVSPASVWLDLPYLRLPWAPGPSGPRGPRSRRGVGAVGATRVVMASRLELRRWRDVPAFLVAALRLRTLFRRSPGAAALSLRAAPVGRVFWTLSVWDDRDALCAYAAHARHVAVMRRFRTAMADSTFVDWPVATSALPTWSDARERIGATMTSAADQPTTTEEPLCGSPS